MTARVTTLKGPDAGAYYLDDPGDYYLDESEPKGRWHGRGAAALGLVGDIDDAAFLQVMAGHDPRTGGSVLLGRRYSERSVRGFDITASAPKSVSVLFAVGDPATRTAALAAHDTAVATMIAWIESHAHTRYRINGQIAVVDADGIIAAAFRQHTSRALDPQLHTHVVIANRVASPDGRWLALDARLLKLDQRTLSAIYHAVLRSELTLRLGVEWQTVVNGIAEIAHLPDQVLETFSSRTAGIQRRIDIKLDRFIDTFERHPTPRERWRLEREAVLESRPLKPQPTTRLHDAWTDQIRNLGHEPAEIIDRALHRVEPRRLDASTLRAMIGQAIDRLAQRQSTWRPAELTRELAAAVPTDLVTDPSEFLRIVDRLTDIAISQYCVDISRPIPDGAIRRRDGRPITESVADRALTTLAILDQEARLLTWAERRTHRAGIDSVAAVDRSHIGLTVPQAQTAAAVAGDADLVLVVGPAGTGKTTALTPAVEQLRAEHRPVFGVAPSAAAADVLAAATGVDADTIDKLVTEHSLQRPPDRRYDLPAGTTVIVDEAAMVATDTLDRFAALADRRNWRVTLVGDPMQFSAVGRGGMFQHLIDTHDAIELDHVHRFTNDWERTASLRLRSGDPTVADLYHTHGRLHGGTANRMETAALDAWETARRHGDTVTLAAPTNETVTRLNNAAQQRRLIAGELDPRGPTVHTGTYRLYLGDDIATRRNHRQLHTDQQHMIRNRDHWTIDRIHPDGDLTVHGPTGTVRLPADYVNHHVELAYAQTSHATQGRTVDQSFLVLDAPTDVRGVYVPLTRGRHQNHAFIVTTGEHTARDILATAITHNWIGQPAHTRHDELNRHQPTLPGPGQHRHRIDQPADPANRLRHEPDDLRRVRHQLDQHRQRLEHQQRRLEAAAATLDHYDRPLRRRRHQPEIANATIDNVILPTQIRNTRNAITNLEATIADLETRHATPVREAAQWPDRNHELDQRLYSSAVPRGNAPRQAIEHEEPDVGLGL